MLTKDSVVFLDTSIVIAIFVHPSVIKAEIRSKLKNYSFRLTGLVVQQEFCRRLLKEAKYLLGQLEKRKSYQKVLSHLLDLPSQQNRKFRICLQTLVNCFPDGTDFDRTERLRYFLEDLLENGLAEIRSNFVDDVVKAVGCASAVQGIRRKKSDYVFPPDSCEKHEQCLVGDFLRTCTDRQPLLDFLIANEVRLTGELRTGMNCLQTLSESDFANACSLNPCLRFGDVLISLESRSAGAFITQNYKESHLLCEQSGQILVVCPVNQDHVR